MGTPVLGEEVENEGASILFFFLLLVILFMNCGLFEDGDTLLFFLLLLVFIFNEFCGFGCGI